MSEKTKKQFSLSMLMRIFLAIIVLISIIVFANSVMKYNKLVEEEQKLEEWVTDLKNLREELILTAGSAERLSEILSDYDEYKRLLNSGSELGIQLAELEIKRMELAEILSESQNRDYIIKIAKEKIGLYFPDEEIFYTNSYTDVR